MYQFAGFLQNGGLYLLILYAFPIFGLNENHYEKKR